MAVFTIKRVDAVLELTRAYLPMRVASDGDFEDWQVIAPALVSIVGDLFEGIASSTPPRGRVRAEVLARSLAEYAIGFAWLAGSGEDRPARIKSVLRDEFGERKKAANKLEKEIAGRQGYKDLFDPEKREGTLPTTLLDQATEERLASLEADTSIKPLPNAMDMAFAADQVWMPQIDMVARNPFALVYFTLVERLNATARELVRSEGKLGSEEIEVGGAAFAAGDQVITRVNDRAAAIYNREWWEVAQVDAERGRIVLDGIDQARRVEVGPDYLSRTTLGGKAPALQHAYAVTTYCAQGTTVDRAYVMADPSMDKQEFYVATSRTREQTYLYATPEIQGERGEYAPTGPERDPIAHVGEAAERDRAQTAAHDEALRAELVNCPPLSWQHGEASWAARPAVRLATRRATTARSRRSRSGTPRSSRPPPTAKQSKRSTGASVARSCPAPRKASGYSANGWLRRERSWSRWSHRARRSDASARSPPSFLTPAQHRRSPPPGSSRLLTSSRSWGRGPPIRLGQELGIEAFRESSYRLEHGVSDRGNAFGREPQDALARATREAAQRRLAETQHRLGLEQQLTRTRELTRSIGRDLGIGL